MKKKILILLAGLLLVSGCKDVKLDNGENAIVTFKEGAISSQDLYTLLKNRYGGEVITDVIDSYLLNKKYSTTQEETSYVNQAVKTTTEAAKSANTSLDNYLSLYYGLNNESAFKDYLALNYKRNLWVEEYAKNNVTDKQVNEYYENYVYGDVEASQILITVDASSDATDEDKTKAEEKALNTAKEVIEKLNKGEDFAKLAKEYSKDQSSSSNGGSLGKVNTGDLASEALDALRQLKDGSYTTTPVKSSDGYHILYRTSMDAKKELTDELKDEIKSTVGSELQKETGYSAKALKALREDNEMKFVDTYLEEKYNNSVN